MARRRRPHTLGTIEILDAERNAFERPGLPCGEAPVGLGCHFECLLGRLDDEAIERPRLLDGCDLRLGQIDGGGLFLYESVARFGEAQIGQITHYGLSYI